VELEELTQVPGDAGRVRLPVVEDDFAPRLPGLLPLEAAGREGEEIRGDGPAPLETTAQPRGTSISRRNLAFRSGWSKTGRAEWARAGTKRE